MVEAADDHPVKTRRFTLRSIRIRNGRGGLFGVAREAKQISQETLMNTQLSESPSIDHEISKPFNANFVADPQNPILQRAMERVRLRRERDVHAAHTTKHGSHASHSKGGW